MTGDFLFVPEGGIHGFRNESGAPASMLLLFAPGAPRAADHIGGGDAGPYEQRHVRVGDVASLIGKLRHGRGRVRKLPGLA